ncbi:MAG: hypothetical protein OXH10_10455 [bacterium]|nr:hypothetical protein [bacterium]
MVVDTVNYWRNYWRSPWKKWADLGCLIIIILIVLASIYGADVSRRKMFTSGPPPVVVTS